MFKTYAQAFKVGAVKMPRWKNAMCNCAFLSRITPHSGEISGARGGKYQLLRF
jgi:hypothetical protein